jgi:diaminohydroxyphosphoribosylaminopyrimidine deaminase / 5-amino-6-(5-phosphoribosylamino)uracil reductase
MCVDQHVPAPSDQFRRAALRALELGRAVAGTTAPNPPVGCVVLRDGVVVGEGATAPVGGPHAEVTALAAAGDAARGATVVVTLEPCGHHGRTPPCAEALIGAGIVEVHVLVRDPDPVAAGGIERLEAAGIRVVHSGACAPDLTGRAREDLRGFLSLVRAGRPHVLLKLAQDATGRTRADGKRYLTGHAARERVHRLRAEVDAVLVGSRTVASDDPSLDVRHVVARRQPVPVVLATAADVDPGARVVSRGAVVLVAPDAPADRVDVLRGAGARVVAVPRDSDGDGLDLAAALAVLPSLGILTLLAEPGPRLAQALLDDDHVDIVELHIAGANRSGHPAPAPALQLSAARFDVEDAARAGEDLVVRARRRPHQVADATAVPSRTAGVAAAAAARAVA